MQAANAKYAKPPAQVGPSQVVMFEGNEITLDIEVEGVVLENGWAITPITYPGVCLCTITLYYDRQQLDFSIFNRSPKTKLITLFLEVKCPPASCM